MNHDDIIRIARAAAEAAGQCMHDLEEDALLAIVTAVAAAEREACAQVYEDLAANAKSAMALRLDQIAVAIRARAP